MLWCLQDNSKRLEAALMEQKVHEATLQLQVAALCAELTRASDVTGEASYMTIKLYPVGFGLFCQQTLTATWLDRGTAVCQHVGCNPL